MASTLVFLTPFAAVLAIGVLLPLAALYFIHRRAERVRPDQQIQVPEDPIKLDPPAPIEF